MFSLQIAAAPEPVLHSMEGQQRAAIEELKQQKAKYVLLLAELQAQKNGVPAAHAEQQQQQQASKLQQLANTYRRKVNLTEAANFI